MQVVVDGLLTHYEIQGRGKTILLIHGWADRLETFRAITGELSKQYQVVALDLPGFGRSQAPQAVWNLDNYAGFITDFLRKIDTLQNLWAVIGHSNGGAVAIRSISRELLKPHKLVLLSASGVRDTAKLRRLAIKTVAKTGKVATFWLPQKTKKMLQKKLYGTVGSDMLVSPQLQETFKRTVRQDIQKDAALLNLPTLLVYGDMDTATPISEVGQKLHELIKNSELKTVAGADHFVHQAEPKKVVGLIQEFLEA